MPKLYMLVGVPGSGKTTWRKAHARDAAHISTDDIIDDIANREGRTYSEVFQDNIKSATEIADARAAAAFAAGHDVVWDQTNLTRKSRRGKLSKVPKNYERIAVYFPVPSDLRARLASRPGKDIPESVILSMISNLEPPTKEEGFDSVIEA